MVRKREGRKRQRKGGSVPMIGDGKGEGDTVEDKETVR